MREAHESHKVRTNFSKANEAENKAHAKRAIESDRMELSPKAEINPRHSQLILLAESVVGVFKVRCTDETRKHPSAFGAGQQVRYIFV